jgi:hypothetical protein
MSINNGGTQSVIGVYESNPSIGALMANGPVAGSKNFRLEFGGKGPYYINTSATSYYVPAFGDYPTTLGNEITLTSFVRSDSGRYVVRTNGKLFNVPGNQSADDLIECPYIGPIQGKLAAIIGYDCDISNFEEAISNELQLQFLIKKSQIKSLLNTYTGAAAAYSVRLLNKSTPYAMRVRRASDNTELNIGFTSVGQLDTTALTNFCTGTNCFVRTWYDQSTNANHAIQTTTANQPKIYDSSTGVLTDPDNGLPAIFIQNTWFNATVGAVTNAMHMSVVNEGPSVSQTFIWSFAARYTNNTAVQFYGGTTFISSATGLPTDQVGLLTAKFDATNSILRFNGVQRANGNTGNTQVVGALMARESGAEKSPNAFVQEMVKWTSWDVANTPGMENMVNDYYSIY